MHFKHKIIDRYINRSHIPCQESKCGYINIRKIIAQNKNYYQRYIYMYTYIYIHLHAHTNSKILVILIKIKKEENINTKNKTGICLQILQIIRIITKYYEWPKANEFDDLDKMIELFELHNSKNATICQTENMNNNYMLKYIIIKTFSKYHFLPRRYSCENI